MNSVDKYYEFIDKYKKFIYKSFNIEQNDNYLYIDYHYEIDNDIKFNHKIRIKINKELDLKDELLNKIIFNIGLIELISYWKAVCAKKIVIECGYLDNEQINWWKKLYFWGLGEFWYINNLHKIVDIDSFTQIKCTLQESNKYFNNNFDPSGNLIPIGGGKDSAVSLELLSDDKDDNICFTINPTKASLDCIDIAGYKNENTCIVNRIIDKKLLELNEKGFFNGHVPFSASVAFISLLCGYIYNKQNIILSNENSANESTVRDSKINHQYSKTLEFEQDFNNYINKYLISQIRYFSLLRPWSELRIAKEFSKHKKYFEIFRSCNVGSKGEKNLWCGACPKCLFVYIILSPFLNINELQNIFHKDLLDDETLFEDFNKLIGLSDTKPFECVGTVDEVRYSLYLTLEKYIEQGLQKPKLLNYFEQNIGKLDLTTKKIHDYKKNIFGFNTNNLLPEKFKKIMQKADENE